MASLALQHRKRQIGLRAVADLNSVHHCRPHVSSKSTDALSLMYQRNPNGVQTDAKSPLPQLSVLLLRRTLIALTLTLGRQRGQIRLTVLGCVIGGKGARERQTGSDPVNGSRVCNGRKGSPRTSSLTERADASPILCG